MRITVIYWLWGNNIWILEGSFQIYWTYSVLFLFFVLENDVLIVFWKFYEKIQRKNLRRITISKKIV